MAVLSVAADEWVTLSLPIILCNIPQPPRLMRSFNNDKMCKIFLI